jgi:hypothetical protein
VLHGFERDADDDQDRGTTETEVRASLVDQDRGEGGDRREERRAWQCEAREYAVEELGCWPAWSNSGDESLPSGPVGAGDL